MQGNTVVTAVTLAIGGNGSKIAYFSNSPFTAMNIVVPLLPEVGKPLSPGGLSPLFLLALLATQQPSFKTEGIRGRPQTGLAQKAHGDSLVRPIVTPRAVLNAKKKKKKPVRYGVISKEPADSTCLHPGVPNCSTMSP